MSVRNLTAFICLSVLALLLCFSGKITFTSRAARDDHHGFDIANMDTSVSACTDFFRYANGGWLAKNPIPAAYPSWGRFNELADKNQEQLHEILEEASKNTRAAKGSNEQKIGDYYASCMDEAAIEAAGLTPLTPELKLIDAIKDQATLQAEVARLQTQGIRVMFRFGSAQDFKQSTQVIAQLFQGGLSLPDRDYYTKTDDKSKELRDKYLLHVAKTLELAGDDSATARGNAEKITAIETRLAEASMTRVQTRNPDNIYHKMTAAQLKEIAPTLIGIRTSRTSACPARPTSTSASPTL